MFWLSLSLIISSSFSGYVPKDVNSACISWLDPSKVAQFDDTLSELSNIVMEESELYQMIGAPRVCRHTLPKNRDDFKVCNTSHSTDFGQIKGGEQCVVPTKLKGEVSATRYEVPFFHKRCQVWWRKVSEDLIPPVPELAIPISETGVVPITGLCAVESVSPKRSYNIGTFYFQGPNFGRCVYFEMEGEGLVEKYRDGGNFHLLQARTRPPKKECRASNAQFNALQYGILYRLHRFMDKEDIQKIQNISGHSIDFLITKIFETMNACEINRILSATRFIPSDLNLYGLHIFRSLLAEKIYEATMFRRGYNEHPDFQSWRQNGIILKDFDDIGDNGLKSLLKVVSGRSDSLISTLMPFQWTERNVTITNATDLQTFDHMDTFASAIKVWIFKDPPGVSLEQGPLHYSKGSHRNSYARLHWMHAYSLPPATEALAEPSFRLYGNKNATSVSGEFINFVQRNKIPVLPFAKRTLVIADTSGIHHRGEGKPGHIRNSLRLRGDNDGGLPRYNPFRLPHNSDMENVSLDLTTELDFFKDIQLSGCNTDCGRVELKCLQDSNKWCAISASNWTLNEANVVCRSLGFQHAVSAMKDFRTPLEPKEAINIIFKDIKCTGNEADLSECRVDFNYGEKVPETGRFNFVGVSCIAAKQKQNQAKLFEISEKINYLLSKWNQNDLQRAGRLSKIGLEPNSKNEKMDPKAPCAIMEGVPLPFDKQLISQAFEHSEEVWNDFYKSMNKNLLSQLCEAQNKKGERRQERLVLMTKMGLQWNVLGMDLSKVRGKLEQIDIDLLNELYFSDNEHGLIHWHLDKPLEKKTAKLTNELQNRYFSKLRRDGVLLIEDIGLREDEIDELIESVTNVIENNSTSGSLRSILSVTSGGAVRTARLPLPVFEEGLSRNYQLKEIIENYLGETVLSGYKATRLDTRTEYGVNAYIASRWHHDRTGRRLKLFVYLHDVDCEEGHPTLYAKGSQNIYFYRTESFVMSRFKDSFVQKHYDVVKGCGKRGQGFLLDTHGIHRGEPAGNNPRTTLIAEYHNWIKCDLATDKKFGLPCPSGDQYIVNKYL